MLIIHGTTGAYERADVPHFIALLGGAVCLQGALSGRVWSGYGVLLCALTAGVWERVDVPAYSSSDVMLATSEALRVLRSGSDPYAHYFITTRPPGQPFPYPPGALAFYGLAEIFTRNVFGVDRWAGIATLGVVAAIVPIVGRSLGALTVTFVALATPLIRDAPDGGNSAGLTFVVTCAIVLLAWSRAQSDRRARLLWWCSAVAFGWALAFKQTSIPVYLALLVYLWRSGHDWRRYALASLGPALVVTLPFVVWDPLGFWTNAALGPFVHANIWGRNLWASLTPAGSDVRAALEPLVPFAMVAGIAVAAAWCWYRPARNLGFAVLQGCALWGTLLVLSRWTTETYYDELIPILVLGVALAFGGDDDRQRSTPSRASISA
jgi:hypothetical protein